MIVEDFYAYLAGLSPAVVDYYDESAGEWTGSTGWRLVRRDVSDGHGDQIVVLTEDGGLEPETPSVAGLGDSALMEPAIQVRVRGEPNDSDGPAAKVAEIFGLLHGLQRTDIGATYYLRVKAQTPEPIYIGNDTKKRPEFTISFRALRAVAAAST